MVDPPRKGTAQFIAPIGIDRERVKRGLQHWFGQWDMPTRITLPISKEWASDPEYKRKVVKPLQAWLDRFRKDGNFKYSASFPELENIDDFESGYAFLVKQMVQFRREEPDSTIYIDTTSAPKTWLIAAMQVLPLFPRVVVYHVKSTLAPSAYPDGQIEDKGGETKPIDVPSGGRKALVGLVSGAGIHHDLLVACRQMNATEESPMRTKEFVPVVAKDPGHKADGVTALRQSTTIALE